MNKTVTAIEPTSQLETPYLDVWIFGKPHDWSLRGIVNDARFSGPYEEAMYGRLSAVCGQKNIAVVLAPTTSQFNALVGTENDFRAVIQPPGGVRLKRGGFFDGVVMPEQTDTAVLFRSGDCPTIIVEDQRTGRIIVSHAGRDSLLQPTDTHRKHSSIVEAILEWFGLPTSSLSVLIICGINAESFPHPVSDPKYGARNAAMIEKLRHEKWFTWACLRGAPEDGCLDLVEIIKAQFCFFGSVPRIAVKTDKVDTYKDFGSDGWIWHSARRGDSARNGILIARR